MKKATALAKYVLFLFLAPLAVAQHQHAFVWSSATGMTDIGTLGGNSYALAVNDSGEVAGWSYLADNITTHAFTWTAAGGMVDIGTLSGGCCSQGQFINSAGDVTGDATNSDGLQSPFYWEPSLGIVGFGLFTTNSGNYGFGINDLRQVTGQNYLDTGAVNAFIWSPTMPFTPLGALPGGFHSVGTAINNHGAIVGTASLPDGNFTGMLWTRATGMQNIGRFPNADYTAAEGINDSNQVVGWGFTSFGQERTSSFYWTVSLGMRLLSTFGGHETFAWGINQQGNIVGHSTLAHNTAVHAVLWTNYTSAPQDLGTLPGGNNSYARGLNNVGQVAGYADVP